MFKYLDKKLKKWLLDNNRPLNIQEHEEIVGVYKEITQGELTTFEAVDEEFNKWSSKERDVYSYVNNYYNR